MPSRTKKQKPNVTSSPPTAGTAEPGSTPDNPKKIDDPIQALWMMHPPPWKIVVDHNRGLILDAAKGRIHGFDAEFDGAYYFGFVAAVNEAAKHVQPDARLKGFRFYTLGEVITDEAKNLEALPKEKPHASPA